MGLYKKIMKCIFSFLLFFSVAVQAETLTSILPQLMLADFEIKKVQAELKSSELSIDQYNAGWLPQLNLIVSEGWEKLNQQVKTDRWRREWGVAMTQLITDFGTTSSAINAAEKRFAKKTIDLQSIKQTVTFFGIKAYLNVYQQKEQLRYAKSSEENIKKQTGMEEARVKQGSGFSTDVLQSKSKLASAYARTARADGEFIKALNDFRSLYQFAPKDLESFIPPGIPRQYIPKKLEDALSIASEFNTDIVKSKFDVEIAQTDITAARSKHFPTITLKGNVKHKRNDQGIIGIKEEYRAGVEFNLPLFSGGKDQAGLSRSYADLNAMKDQRLHVRREVDKKVRNAWQDFQTDQINAGFLRNSANISEQFLVLARQERKLGRRSLIDVLSEENSYINALQAAIKAETSVLLSAYALLKEMGILNAKMVY